MERDLEKINKVSNIPCVLVDRFIKLEAWERLGKPRLLLKVDSSEDNSIVLYEDIGYGHLFLVVGDEVFQGRDFVSDSDNEWVGLSGFFTGNVPCLYKRV